jgi:two-component system LytT family response regulator
MKTLRTIVADDERISRTRLHHLLEHTPGIEVIAECASGPATVEAVRAAAPDLLLLDIQMPGMDGLAVAQSLNSLHHPAVIFVTVASAEAARAFDVEAVDFIVKPVSSDRLWKALARARRRLADADFAAAASAQAAQPAAPAHIEVRNAGHIRFIQPAEIDWVEACGNYTILHTGQTNHIRRETMSNLEAQLPEETFFRVSRSAIVNLTRIRQIEPLSSHHHAAVLADGTRIPLTCSVRELAARIGTL